jgi:PTS system mannose-specific IIB component
MKALGSTRIVIVDDKVAADAFLQDVLRMAAPPGSVVEVCSVADSPKVLNDSAGPRAKTMVILKSPEAALRMREAGVDFKVLQVGGIGAAPGRKPIYRNISVSPQEVAILKKLKDLGVETIFQIGPEEKAVPLSALVKQ